MRYGITTEQYKEMLEKQGHKCGICGTKQERLRKRLFIDHDHDTGAVRGLLCMKCNSGLGMFNDDVKIVGTAKTYLLTASKESSNGED